VNSTERKADGHLLRKYAYTYNDRGNLMQTVAYDSNERISLTVTYSYVNAEHLVEKAQYSKDGSLITRTAYTHDAKGFVIEELESDAKGRARTRTESNYEFNP
jgi:hypothetical protein